MKNDSVHTMPLANLRARVSEVMRIIAEARVIAQSSFAFEPSAMRQRFSPREAAERVGMLLDAAQRLLPGMPPLAEAHDRAPRSKPNESASRRVTMRGGPEQALAQIERAKLLESIAEEAAILFAEIERGRTSTHFPASESWGDSERQPRSSARRGQ